MRRACFPAWFAVVVLAIVSPASHAATQLLTVTVNGSGIVHRNPTNTVVPQGAIVTLTAIPETNWLFTSWSGDLTAVTNPVNLVMDRDKAITANFSRFPEYALSVSVEGQGTVTPQGGTYPSNTSVTLTATPIEGWVFNRWKGDVAGNANPLTLMMTTNKAIAAVFLEPPSIVTHPQNVSTGPGTTVSFHVSATGSSPLAYQWQFNGTPVANAFTADMTITNVQPGQSGNYRVVVANSAGSITSQVALLTITNLCGHGSNVVTVCTEADLRQAVARGGVVEFCCGGTINLTGGIAVERNVELRGGENPVAISGGGFGLGPNVTLVLSNLWLVNNAGAAISNRGGVVRLLSCVVSNNTAGSATAPPGNPVRGGALYNQAGVFSLVDTLVISNSVIGGNVPFSFPPPSIPGGDAIGGALYSETGSVFISRSIFKGNTARGGNGYRHSGCGAASGGAIYASGTLVMDETTFIQNAVFGGGGSSQNNGNGNGGAIYSAGLAYINSSTFDQNYAVGGIGGAGFGTPMATYAGADGNGGAIFNAGVLLATNCTLASNRSEAGGTLGFSQMPRSTAYGGGVLNAGTLHLMNVTIASNIVVQGRLSPLPHGANIVNTGGTFLMRNSLIVHGVAITNGPTVVAWTNGSGVITDGGFNISSDGSCNFNSGSSFNFTDPRLGPLRDNGGPTLTMQPVPGSPAIDFGTADGAPPTDQRGARRPSGTGVDMGAFEVGPIGPALPSLTLQANGSSVTLSFYAEAGIGYQLWSSTDLVTWQMQEPIPAAPANGMVSRSLTANGSRRFFRLQ